MLFSDALKKLCARGKELARPPERGQRGFQCHGASCTETVQTRSLVCSELSNGPQRHWVLAPRTFLSRRDFVGFFWNKGGGSHGLSGWPCTLVCVLMRDRYGGMAWHRRRPHDN